MTVTTHSTDFSKRRAVRFIGGLLVLAGLLLGYVFVPNALAWDDCPRGEVDCVYPGECSRYVDTNGDGICDHSQAEPVTTTAAVDTTATTPATAAAATTATTATTTATAASNDTDAAAAAILIATGSTDTIVSTTPSTDSGGSTVAAADTATVAVATGAAAAIDSGGYSFFTHYYISPIALAFFLVYAVSFVLYKTKRMRVSTHRKIWNVLLLVTFLITGVFGLLLAIQLDYELPFTIPIDMLFWHVEAGIVMTLISLFHMGWHFNYYKNLLRSARTKRRAAEAAEREAVLRGAGRTQVAPVPERAQVCDRQ
jgi:hypothetical protein